MQPSEAPKLTTTPPVTNPNSSPAVTPSEVPSEAQPVERSSIEAVDTLKAPTTLPEDEIALKDSAEMVHSKDMEVDSDPPQIDICPPIDEETDRIPSPTPDASPRAEGEIDMDVGSDEPEVDDHLRVVSDNGRFRESSLESGEIRSCSAERASLLHSPIKAEGASINGNGHLQRTPASPLNGATYPVDLGLSSPSSIRDTPETQILAPSSQPINYGEKIRELLETTTLPISGPAFRPGAIALAVFQGEQTQADLPTSFPVQGEVLSSLERWKNRYKTTE
ncbi:hypothetical protein ONZ45_g3231 [Pleurotus djamor]|nr:hypothetical protein ONZ45_g3231 [Pleurotus djamor]